MSLGKIKYVGSIKKIIPIDNGWTSNVVLVDAFGVISGHPKS